MKNREDIEIILLDYINGKLEEKQVIEVRQALEADKELFKLYNGLKNTICIIDKVKLEDPPQFYFTNLLPRIHDRIENKSAISVYNRFKVFWKILIPVTAILLIFIVYNLFVVQDNQITQEINNNNDVIEDTIKIKEKINPELNDTNEINNEIYKSLTDSNKKNNLTKQFYNNKYLTIDTNIFVTENNTKKPVIKENNEYDNNDEGIAEVLTEYDEEEIESIYDESESDYNKMSKTEKTDLIKKLNNINL